MSTIRLAIDGPLARVTLDEVGPVTEAGVRDVLPPVGAAARLALEGQNTAAEVASCRGEPDRRIAAFRTDLQHLAVGLRCTDGKEKQPRAVLDGNAGRPWLFQLEPTEDRTDTIVEHQAASAPMISCSTSSWT